MMSVLFAACIFLACGAGICGWRAFSQWKQKSHYKGSISVGEETRDGGDADDIDGDEGALSVKVLEVMRAATRESALGLGGVTTRFARTFKGLFASRWFCSHGDKAGVGDSISEQGYCLARLRLCLLGAAVGALVGIVVSTELCIIGMIAGGAVGFRLPKKTLARRIEERTLQMEHHLPEMLDVIALGMRSGLSFDSSIKLYTSHFKTYLAREFANAQRQWSSGLEYRDEGLRKIAASYESQIFKRVIETIIRSVRFGSSMVESLEEQSAEARVAYRTRREEQVAKAPVKMMIPTGTLILPAMLIMVIGPVLLELMGGGL